MARRLFGIAVGLLLTMTVHAVEPGDCVYEITLDKAMPNDTPLVLVLDCEDGVFTRGLGTTPRFTRAAHSVEVEGLKVGTSKVEGQITVTVHSDGYNPANWQSVKAVYTIAAELKNDTLTGTFEGRYGEPPAGDTEKQEAESAIPEELRKKLQPSQRGRTPPPASSKRAGSVTGRIMERPTYNGLQDVKLNMEVAKGENRTGKAIWGQRAFVNILLKDGKAVHGLVRGHGGNPINYFEADITGMDLALKNGTLAGTMEVHEKTVRKDKAEKISTAAEDVYVYRFDLPVVGSRLGGQFGKNLNGKDLDPGPVSGTLAPPPELAPRDAFYYLVLFDAVAGDHQLMMYLSAKDGAFTEGAGFSGRWNHTFHDVTARALSLDGDALAGDINVTLNPDPYVPPDKKPVPCAYQLDARVADGRVTGSYKGTCGDQRVQGRILGELRTKPSIPEPVKINVKLDNGVCDGAPWHRRCYIGFTAVDGKADSGGISNNKGGFKGTFTSAEVLEFTDASFKAVIKANVHESGQVLKGDYAFHLTGKVIGSELVGKVDTELNGEMKKKGTDFMGSFHAAQ